MRAIVAGGGLAGMVAATHLAEAGATVTVLEKQPYLGGRLSTPMNESFDHQGKTWDFPVEHGIHGYWWQYRNLFRLLEQQGLRHRLIDSKSQELVIWLDGDHPRFMEVGDRVRDSALPEPFCFMELLREREFQRLAFSSGPVAMWKMARDLGHAFAFDPAFDMEMYERLSVEQWIGAWPAHMREFFRAMTHSAFFIDVENTSLGAFLTSLQFYTVTDKRAIGFEYMDGDTNECVLEPLAANIRAKGGRVLTGNTVEDVLVEQGRVTGVVAHDGRRSRKLKADALVLALDPPGMKGLRSGALGSALPELQVPKGVHSLSVRLWFEGRPGPDRSTNGMFASPDRAGAAGIDNYFWLSTIQKPYVEWAESCGGSTIEAHQYGLRAKASADRDDEEILDAVTGTVEAAWPGVRGTLVHRHLKRNPPTHTEFNPGTWDLLPEVTTKIPNVALCGDWIRPRYPVLYLERTASTGLDAARAVAPSLGIDARDMDEVMPLHPPSPGFLRTRAILRGMRDLGLLPDLSRR